VKQLNALYELEYWKVISATPCRRCNLYSDVQYCGTDFFMGLKAALVLSVITMIISDLYMLESWLSGTRLVRI
jgi:hypothetical protein